MRLLHYSHEPITEVIDKDPASGGGGYRKPRGLWVSVEDGHGWRWWCETNEFAGGWLHIYDVTIAQDANILTLTTVCDLDAFDRDYAIDVPFGAWRDHSIDWAAVGADYDGIIIAPYQWRRRLDTPVSEWYYSWDCSSGCIWRARAIERITLVEEAA